MRSSFPLRHTLFAAAMSFVLILSGCGGGSSAPDAGEVRITHLPKVTALSATKNRIASTSASPLPDGVDAMQIEFFDSNGRSILGPIEVDAEPVVDIRNVPLSAASTTVSYLRNGGFELAEDNEAIAWNGRLGTASPVPAASPAAYTRWKTAVDANGVASVSLSSSEVGGGAAKDFLIKGVAYSPAPIGANNKEGPAFGDYFWDTPGGFLDWDRVWKRDLENIRMKGFNAVRVYSLIANPIFDNGAIPSPADIAADPELRVREHKKFLDAAWNNGVNPIYVLAGIPTPDKLWKESQFRSGSNAAVIEFWDNNFTASLNQLKDHPAIIGFTMFNEQGGADDYQGSGAKHYWSQVQKYSQRAKQIAPDKLIGWAFFDNPDFARNTVAYRREYAKSIDFYGMNAFQPVRVSGALDPWQKSIQGDTARPVFMTEFGIPATGRRNDSKDPSAFYADDTTVKKAADSMARMLPLLFQHPAVAGVFYFEWSDEWWKQDSVSGFPRFITRQEGSNTFVDYFPNLWYDEEGFGLHAIALDKRAADKPYSDKAYIDAGNTTVDILTERTSLMDAVTTAYKNAEQVRKNALGF